MESKTVSIPSMNCGHCLNTIKNELLELEGVNEVNGDPATKAVTVSWNSPAVWDVISTTLDEIGFSAE